MEASRFPNRLRKYRMMQGLSQKQVAKLIGIKDTSTLSRWEKGRMYPPVSKLFRMARIYKTIPQELYTYHWETITVDYTQRENNLLSLNDEF